MMEQLLMVEKFLKETIWGILILGASGSIIGAILIQFFKKLFKFANSHKEQFLFAILYKLIIAPYQLGEKFASQSSPSKDTKYLVWCIGDFLELTIILFMLISAIGIGLIILLFFGLDRPYSLSTSMSISLLLSYSFLRKLLYCSGFLCKECLHLRKDIKLRQPKNLTEYIKTKKA